MTFKTVAPHIVRILLGLSFFVFGLNGFLHFLPQPPPPPAAGQFAAALGATGYMWPFIKGTETLVGLLLLSNRLVPLALILLAPVMLNIVAFHTFLEPAATLPLPLILMALQVSLAWMNRKVYAPLFALPSAAREGRPTVGTLADA